MEGFAIDVDFAGGLRIVTQTVDEGGEVAFEDHREVAAYRVDLADAEQVDSIAVDGQHLAIRRNGGHALLGTAQVVGPSVEADQDVAGMRCFEDALFDNGR